MVKGVASKRDDRERVGALLPSLSIGADMIVAMFATFIVSFVAASSAHLDYSYCLVAGLGGAVTIMFVEMALFVMRDHRRSQKEVGQAAGR